MLITQRYISSVEDEDGEGDEESVEKKERQ